VQEARCIEELQILRFERQRTLQYYKFVNETCSRDALARLDTADNLLHDAKAQSAESGGSGSGGVTGRRRSSSSSSSSSSSVPSVHTAQLVDTMNQYSQLLAEAVLLDRIAEQHSTWLARAKAAFANL